MLLEGEISILPITADPLHEFTITNLNGNVTFYFLLERYGISLMTSNFYYSVTGYSNSSLAGASNKFFSGIGFFYSPKNYLSFHIGQNFIWNRSAYKTKMGTIAENRLGTGIVTDLYFIPQIKYPYFKFSQHNIFQFYPHTRKGNFQIDYEGTFRFSVTPNFPYLHLFVENGLLYLNYDTEAAEYHSISFLWRMGARFSYEWKNNTKQEESRKEPEVQDLILPETSKEEDPAAPSLPLRTDLYKELEESEVNQTIKITGIYFNRQNQIMDSSFPILNELISFLKEHPTIVIVIISYVENNALSDEQIIQQASERTNAIKTYLESRGILKERIKRSPSAITYHPYINSNGKLSNAPFIEIKIIKK